MDLVASYASVLRPRRLSNKLPCAPAWPVAVMAQGRTPPSLLGVDTQDNACFRTALSTGKQGACFCAAGGGVIGAVLGFILAMLSMRKRS